MKTLSSFTADFVFWLGTLVVSAQVDIGCQFVPVGSPGNANDPATGISGRK
jgi:hypothetical protein